MQKTFLIFFRCFVRNRGDYYGDKSSRSVLKQSTGYSSFKPCNLPPNPEIVYDAELMTLLSTADRLLGRLDGVTQTLPNPNLFVAMYVRKEAVLSSQIEGTQASLTDVLNPEEAVEKKQAISEVVNYVNAMNYGLDRLKELPLSLRLIREIHSRLLESGRGSQKNPGEFRSTQNWIGPAGCTLTTATFVPPTVPDMKEAFSNVKVNMRVNIALVLIIRMVMSGGIYEGNYLQGDFTYFLMPVFLRLWW